MQGSVFVDENGNAFRPPMNDLDQKGVLKYKTCMGRGLPDPGNKEIYERSYRVFKKLYKANTASFMTINA